ncbi:AAA domain-containing protein [Nocardia aurantia]|uniref:AAA+ ATPase domain-containing protein n=1 Tax=Nocardia aurantia TaxID=2585199 RepID=A0A7K0DQY4_9NOCA|nr:AAA domain-containing protein [Nocardia aurantia]MQY27998.1 hypothetical protein [Nocardia aurantia]
MSGVQGGAVASPGSLADRGARLFEFLARAQAVGMSRIEHISTYASEGAVLWIADLPEHAAVSYTDATSGQPFLRVEKVTVTTPPETEYIVRPWLHAEAIDDPATEPALRDSLPGAPGEEPELLSRHPEVSEAFGLWLTRWRHWAERARIELEAQRLYQTLYQMYTRQAVGSETLEAVLGIGCLEWSVSGARGVKRHVLTVAVEFRFNSELGTVAVAIDPDATRWTVELPEILENSMLAAPKDLARAEEAARDGGAEPFDREPAGALVKMLIHCINSDAVYLDDLRPVGASKNPTATYAPAVILRRRGKAGMVKVLRSISDRIRDTGVVPAGVRSLVEVNLSPEVAGPVDDGAMVRHGDDCFLPKPLNRYQLEVLRHVDSHAHTIVQGPPGTGKTHTAAALITHLLAQGKRVLVTAQTDRALEEVRNQLPDGVKSLAVSVVGTTRNDFAHLRTAVDTIKGESDSHDSITNRRRIDLALGRVRLLGGQRADLQRQLLRVREHEVSRHEIAGYSGTLAEIATRYRADRPLFEWIESLADARLGTAVPASGVEICEWRALLVDVSLDDPEADRPESVALHDIPSPDEFERWCTRLAEADAACRGFDHLRNQAVLQQISLLTPEVRARARDVLLVVQSTDTALRRRPEAWVAEALDDIRARRTHEWSARAERIGQMCHQLDRAVAALGYTEVSVTGDDRGRLAQLAETLKRHIAESGPLKTNADGSPKTGLLTPKTVKESAELFQRVRVDGRFPTSIVQLDQFLRDEHIGRQLHALDLMWPGSAIIPEHDTHHERLAWHRGMLQILLQVLEFDSRLRQAAVSLSECAVPVPSWSEFREIRLALEVLAAADAIAEWQTANATIDTLAQQLAAPANRHESPSRLALETAVRHRRAPDYRLAHERLAALRAVHEKFHRRTELGLRLQNVPKLREAVAAAPGDPAWDVRLAAFEAAWNWAAAGRWLFEQSGGEANRLCRMLDAVEADLRAVSEHLAVTRAWDRAVGPGRLPQKAKAYLTQYAQLVKRLGKGTGMHAEQRRSDIRAALKNCRDAVPVWIMPIYRFVEQFPVDENMFDVVIVDEASQAGQEAVFLQYLAPRIVVIGDDKQVSPSAVGIDETEVKGLVSQYLHDDEFKASWSDPKRSLFDEALVRFPARLTLVEHRRCVPEIIEFSNRIAYAPDGVRLIPVRRCGSDRLPPIRSVYVPDGSYESNRTNPIEADRLVDQLERCLADPRYDGKTFGVISLTGTAQVKLLTQQLMNRIPPEEQDRRQLRCGDAADFQGAERDVIFLSMVAAPGPDRRLTAQTTDTTVQRYNVAVSRAKDQLWVFHSVRADELTNSADMRFQLLDYCQQVEQRVLVDTEPPQRVPDDRIVEPFDSLFEQQIFNCIVDRGYQVVAHHSDTGYEIDMVVVGRQGLLAVQCDGDRWAGPEEFRLELDAQRDLERCEWPFHRIRQFDFIIDAQRCLGELWELLEGLGIRPIADEMVETRDILVPATDAVESAMPRPAVGPVQAPAEADIELVGEFPDLWDPQQAHGAGSSSAVGNESCGPHAIKPYLSFIGQLESPTLASHAGIAADFVSIVAVEGPVTGARLRAAYVAAARTRQRDDVRRKLDHALAAAVDRGDLLVDDELDLGDPNLLTYRVAGQEITQCRDLGPRSLDQVPPRELAEIMAVQAADYGWDDRDVLMRAVLEEVGQKQLTDLAIAALALVLPLAKQIAESACRSRPVHDA